MSVKSVLLCGIEVDDMQMVADILSKDHKVTLADPGPVDLREYAKYMSRDDVVVVFVIPQMHQLAIADSKQWIKDGQPSKRFVYMTHFLQAKEYCKHARIIDPTFLRSLSCERCMEVWKTNGPFYNRVEPTRDLHINRRICWAMEHKFFEGNK